MLIIQSFPYLVKYLENIWTSSEFAKMHLKELLMYFFANFACSQVHNFKLVKLSGM